jgi:hypothetical protein|tara:strand:- start:698 stop:904 length:207 start_codon:yes stop_codon:yes gene_type:complete
METITLTPAGLNAREAAPYIRDLKAYASSNSEAMLCIKAHIKHPENELHLTMLKEYHKDLDTHMKAYA